MGLDMRDFPRYFVSCEHRFILLRSQAKSQQYKEGEKRREAEEIDRKKAAQRRKVRT